MRSISWEERRLLEKYWSDHGFELCAPFIDTTEAEKTAISKSLGFRRYVFAVAILELKKAINEEVYRILPKWLRNLLKNNVN